MKALLLICDGMADRPVPELGNKTPLEIADTPNMDWLAKHGICGIMDIISPGIPPGSDTAHLALLGYDPFEVYTGRGPFEAAGAGIDLKPGDVAFRVNFATVDESMRIVDRRAGRIGDTKPLEEALQKIKLKGVQVIFKSTVGHRGTLVLRGQGLSADVTDSDPHTTGEKPLKIQPILRAPSPSLPALPIYTGGIRKYVVRRSWATKTARLLNEFSTKAHEILKNHPANIERAKEGLPPANYLLLRGGGVAPFLPSFRERWGLEGACVAAAALVKGVCRFAGMDIIDVPGATGSVNTNLDGKAKAALKALETHDFVLLHIKGFDEAGHDGNPRAKIDLIERTDKILAGFIDAVDLIAIAVDHTTPVSVRDHAGDPVPVMIYGAGVRVDDVQEFGERSVAKGGLGRIRGKDLLPTMIDLMGKSKKFGA
ncbi:MAG: 2,3-bisphosphoglycerate-independent phosphoglycerate mutase [Candidatus Hadarchaeales archaeon]